MYNFRIHAGSIVITTLFEKYSCDSEAAKIEIDAAIRKINFDFLN